MPAQLQLVLALEAEPVAIDITGEATDDAAPFSSASSDLSSRGRTASTVMWAPEAWEDGESGLDQRTPDLSDVIQALIDAGFVLERFAEHPFTVFEMWPWLEERDGQTTTWWAPEGHPSLPMMYSLVARRPV